jgi:hypothetical protein
MVYVNMPGAVVALVKVVADIVPPEAGLVKPVILPLGEAVAVHEKVVPLRSAAKTVALVVPPEQMICAGRLLVIVGFGFTLIT